MHTQADLHSWHALHVKSALMCMSSCPQVPAIRKYLGYMHLSSLLKVVPSASVVVLKHASTVYQHTKRGNHIVR